MSEWPVDRIASAIRRACPSETFNEADAVRAAKAALSEMHFDRDDARVRRLIADYGFSEDDLGRVYDPRLIRMLSDFARLREGSPPRS